VHPSRSDPPVSVPFRPDPWIVPLGAGLAALVLYLLTAAPTITWRNGGIDSGELATAVATGGVAHPPGYPTYLLLGSLVALLPVEPARSLAWLSAVCAAVAVACAAIGGSRGAAEVALAAQEADGRSLSGAAGSGRLTTLLGAIVPASILATSHLLWASATYAEVNAPAAAVCGLWLVLRPWQLLAPRRLAAVGLLLGAGMGLHALLGFLVMPTALGQLRGSPLGGRARAARLAILAGALGLGACVFALLAFWPAGGPVNWYSPQAWDGWRRLVTAEAYRGLLEPGGAPARALFMLRLLVENLAILGAVAAVAGVQEVLARKPWHGSGGTLACAATALLYVLFAALYIARDSEVYLLPSLILLSPAMGAGAASASALVRRAAPRALPLVAVVLLLPAALQMVRGWPALNLRDDRTALTYARDVLASAPPGGAIIASGDAVTFSLWYVRYALGARPDVSVVNEDLLYEDWYRGQLRRLHPDLVVPAWAPGLEAPAQLVEGANRGRVIWAPEPTLP
jgi:hypothetical protein